jgi:hypothetical protein
LQDDVLPCTDFDARLRAAIEEKPDQLVSLFVGNMKAAGLKPYRAAQAKNENWCALHRSTRIIHVVGLVWPVEAAAAFLDWYEREGDRMPVRKPHRSDDQAVGYWLKNSDPHRTLWATVPSLVEHPDDFIQVARTKQRSADAGRRAISFAG